MAPRAVADFEVAGQENGVRLAWRSPEEDRRGKELKSIEGYQIQRKEIVNRGDETAPSVHFKDLAFIKDTHIEVRDKLRAEARAQGKIGRTVQASEELTVFGYVDTSAQRGASYIYQIVPQNQSATDGVVREVARVVFKGAQTEVDIVPADDIAEEKLSVGAAPQAVSQEELAAGAVQGPETVTGADAAVVQ
jgi:hypothetical protein